MLEVVVGRPCVDPRGLVTAKARVHQSHDPAQPGAAQGYMTGIGRLVVGACERLGVAQTSRRTPELLAIDAPREQVAGDAEFRVAGRTDHQGQTNLVQDLFLRQAHAQAASAIVGRRTIRGQRRLPIEEHDPGRVVQRGLDQHPCHLEDHGRAGSRLVDPQVLEALHGPGVVSRCDQNCVVGFTRDPPRHVHHVEGLALAHRHLDCLLHDLEVELLELLCQIRTSTLGPVGAHRARPNGRKSLHMGPCPAGIETLGARALANDDRRCRRR